MELLEIIEHDLVSEETLEQTIEIGKAMGKTTISEILSRDIM